MNKFCSRLAALIILSVYLVGCNPGSETTKPAGRSVPGNSTGTSKGPGDFDLADPAIGLDGLHGCHQYLQTTFEGKIAGEQRYSKMTLNRDVVDDPLTQLSWMEIDDRPVQFFGSIGSVNYQQPSPEQACTIFSVDDSNPQPAAAAYPMASLPPVFGAESANEEEVNGIAAKHYTFDERAIGFAGMAVAQGEIWVASSGGYILRYTLRLDAPEGILGPDVKGVQTWFYELSEINLGTAGLPENCQQLQENATMPVMDGARVILQQPGYLVYQVTGEMDAAIAFYQQQAEALGWSSGTPFGFEEVTRLTLRPNDGRLLQLTFESSGGILMVTVQTLDPLPAN